MICRLSPQKCSQGGQLAPRCLRINAHVHGADKLVNLTTASATVLANSYTAVQPIPVLSLPTVFLLLEPPLGPCLQHHSLAGLSRLAPHGGEDRVYSSRSSRLVQASADIKEGQFVA